MFFSCIEDRDKMSSKSAFICLVQDGLQYWAIVVPQPFHFLCPTKYGTNSGQILKIWKDEGILVMDSRLNQISAFHFTAIIGIPFHLLHYCGIWNFTYAWMTYKLFEHIP